MPCSTTDRDSGPAAPSLRTAVATLIAVLLLAGCAADGARPEPPPPIQVPVGFDGVLPCVDCPGIRTALLLRADRVFLLRQTWLGRDSGEDSLVDVGRWRWRGDGEAVLLDLDAGTRQYAVTDEGHLRLLDRLGREVVSGAPAELLPADVGDAFQRPWRWRGMYRQAGGEGLFHDCSSGLTRPVLEEDAFAQLERAYAAQRSIAGAWLLVTLQGRLKALPAPGEQEDARREGLQVSAVDRTWPGEDCGRRVEGSVALAGLEDTVWWLTDISGAPLPAKPASRPRLRLFPESDRLEGFGGCNVILGDYVADASRLSFSDVSSTYKECAGSKAIERRLVQTLREVDAYTVDAGELRLYAVGEVIARFSAAAPSP